MVLYLRQNEKRKIIIKLAMMIFRLLGFGPYYQERPSWHIKGKLSNVKRTDANEYCLKMMHSERNGQGQNNRKAGTNFCRGEQAITNVCLSNRLLQACP